MKNILQDFKIFLFVCMCMDVVVYMSVGWHTYTTELIYVSVRGWQVDRSGIAQGGFTLANSGSSCQHHLRAAVTSTPHYS